MRMCCSRSSLLSLAPSSIFSRGRESRLDWKRIISTLFYLLLQFFFLFSFWGFQINHTRLLFCCWSFGETTWVRKPRVCCRAWSCWSYLKKTNLFFVLYVVVVVVVFFFFLVFFVCVCVCFGGSRSLVGSVVTGLAVEGVEEGAALDEEELEVFFSE